MMNWNVKLVTTIVLCYQNTLQQIQKTLQSIFEQVYPRIEIIIADDGSTGFDRGTLVNWIEINKSNCIQQVHVLHLEQNQGTVRNLRNALEYMNGEYYMTLGAADVLAKNDVISHMMMIAALFQYKDLLITGRACHVNDEYKDAKDILSSEDYSVMRKRDTQALYSRLFYRCCIATVATLYRRDFASVCDAYDVSYYYYEDYPSFLRMARKGITPLFLNKLITLHPEGGIANGAVNKDIETVKKFYQDRELLYKKEIKPYLKSQTKYTKIQLKIRRDKLKAQYLWDLWKRSNYRQRLVLIQKHPWRLFFSLKKGDVFRGRLFRMGIGCLLLLSVFSASGLTYGSVVNNIIEITLLLGTILGCITNILYLGFDGCMKIRSLYRTIIINTEKNRS